MILFLNNIGVTMIIQNWFIFCTILDYKKWKIYTVKKVSKHWLRALWGKKLCQCSLSNCSSNSDLSLCLLDQYILWFPRCSWEHCVNGPFGSCVCLRPKGPSYTTVISFTLRKFKLWTLFLHYWKMNFMGHISELFMEN